jgi:hypothetical protein
VNQHKEVLQRELSLLFGDSGLELTWLSPLAEDSYREYWDKRALTRLGLEHLSSDLAAFWPSGGPHWDALAIGRTPQSTFRLLIEAKSHIPEMNSHCTAKAAASVELITSSLQRAQAQLGLAQPFDWMTKYYQYANRLAWLTWLQSHVPTRLVNIYFTNDEHAPTTSDEWLSELVLVKMRMGVTAPIPGAYDLFLTAMPYPVL